MCCKEDANAEQRNKQNEMWAFNMFSANKQSLAQNRPKWAGAEETSGAETDNHTKTKSRLIFTQVKMRENLLPV